MSKIKITELNNCDPSKLEILNEAESAEVVGGGSYHYRFPAFDFSAYISAKFNVDLKKLEHLGKNASYQIAIGGKKYSFVSQYKHGGNTHNYAFVQQ